MDIGRILLLFAVCIISNIFGQNMFKIHTIENIQIDLKQFQAPKDSQRPKFTESQTVIYKLLRLYILGIQHPRQFTHNFK